MKLTAEADCPACKRSIQLEVGKMRPGSHVTCPRCKTRIELSGADGKKIQDALDSLERTMKKLGK